MDAPVSLNPGVGPPWPFPITTVIYTVAGQSGPYWEGDWQTPPPEVCDILTASEWQIEFEFDPLEIPYFIGYPYPVILSTTIKPGQIKRRILPSEIEYIVGGEGYKSVVEIFDQSFLGSVEYPDDTLENELFKLDYSWQFPVIEDGEPVPGVFNEVNITISLQFPKIGKDETDNWVWVFESLASYRADLLNALDPEESSDLIITGNVINFMGNQHVAPATGFPVVSLSIVSHFGDV